MLEIEKGREIRCCGRCWIDGGAFGARGGGRQLSACDLLRRERIHVGPYLDGRSSWPIFHDIRYLHVGIRCIFRPRFHVVFVPLFWHGRRMGGNESRETVLVRIDIGSDMRR